MHDFVLKEVVNADMKKELEKIGFDKSYINKASEKFDYKNIKIYNLTPAQANILKQTALSSGSDCATNKNTITGEGERSDCILGGSVSELKKIAQKLQAQPFGLKKLSQMIEDFISKERTSEPKIVGILNLTKNSFSDGYYNFDDAVFHLNKLLDEGADLIDIGAESTKPYSEPVSAEEQSEKLMPVLEYIKKKNIKIPISIDTRSSVVAEKCLDFGVEIINDVSGFDYDKNMPNIIAKYNAKVIIQHSKGTPDIMQNNPFYENLTDEIYLDLKNKINSAVLNGIKYENIIIDPGIGFGKTRADNFEIIKRIREFYGLGCPVMLGISRKSLLNMPDEDNFVKDIFTTALNVLAVIQNVDYLRVHNVKLHKILLDLLANF